MALTGPEAKPNKLGHSPTAEWREVANVPFDDGGVRDLPKSPGGRRKWHPEVLEWWAAVRRMPHCVTWGDTDWLFARETAFYKQQLWRDVDQGDLRSTLATEVRRREDQIGTTDEARRKLRIRYVDPAATEKRRQGPAGLAAPVGGDVVSLDDRRARLTG